MKQVQKEAGLECSRTSRATGAGAELKRKKVTGDESFLLLLLSAIVSVVSTTV